MISPKSIEKLISRSKQLRSALLNVIAADDPIEIQVLPDDLLPVVDSLENLFDLVKDNKDLESQYSELADVYLITSRLTESAALSLNNRFSSAYQLAQELHQLVIKYLSHLDILIKRKQIEDSLFDMSPGALETHFNEKINKLTKNFDDSVKNIRQEIHQELVQFEEESINRILVAGQSAEKRIESGLRQLAQLENSLNTVVEKELTNFSESSNELQALSLQAIRSASSDASNSIQKQLSTAISSFESHYNKQIGTINSRIDDEVREFESKKFEITEVLGEISTAYQAGANTTQADKEQGSADSYRKYGIIGLVATIFCSIWLFNDYIHFFGKPSGTVTPINDLGFGWFALRFMTISLLTAPSIYMLKESAYHRSKENLYRQRGTQLASIGAYLGELDPSERAAMKKELAANFFSFYDGKADTSNVPDFIKNMNEAIKLAHAIKTPHSSEPPKRDQPAK